MGFYFMLLCAVGEYFILITIIIIQNGVVCLGIHIMYSLGNKLQTEWSLSLESTWANGEKCCILEINTKQVDGAAGSHIEEKWAASVFHCIFINSTCLCKWQEDINTWMERLTSHWNKDVVLKLYMRCPTLTGKDLLFTYKTFIFKKKHDCIVKINTKLWK